MNYFNKFPIGIFLLLSVIATFNIYLVNLGFKDGEKIIKEETTAIDAAMEIKFELTQAHLWIEELIGGDKSIQESDIHKHIKNAKWYINALLHGGTNSEGVFAPIESKYTYVRTTLQKSLLEVEELHNITKKRLDEHTEHIEHTEHTEHIEYHVGSDIDQEFDDIFNKTLKSIDDVETAIQHLMKIKLEEYNDFKQLLFIAAVLFYIIVMVAFYFILKSEKSWIYKFYKIQDQKDEAESATHAKSVFLANMSHEIRTPMNAVIGMTELALEEELNSKAKNYIEKAHLSAENLLGIINDILDISKVESGKLHLDSVHFKLQDVISHTLHLISVSSKEKALKTKVKIDKDVPKYYFADSLRLGQVLTNLVNNAVKFSHYEGVITIGASLKEQNDKNAVVEFYIEDQGVGISKDNQEKLFKSFSQAESSTTRKFGGTGLGLAISKKIVELMDGDIWVNSTEGVGSRFSFIVTMQLSDERSIVDSTKQLQNSHESFTQQLQNRKILLVEDNEINQELAVDMLEKKGIVVTIASNGQEAVDILKTQPFDLVLMDIQMPVMDGYEATKLIRAQEKYKDLPILSMTANVLSGDRDKARVAGMNDTIAKPIVPVKMFETIVKWINKIG